jgi:YVTN family beta-propeller protein
MPRLPLLLSTLLLAACSSTGHVAPPGSWLAVLDKSDATLRVLHPDTGHLKDKVPTGVGPHECAASPDGRLIVVCNYGDQRPGSSLLVWDTVERRTRQTIDLSPHQRPHGIAFLSNRTVLVTSETSQAVLEVDVARGAVERVLPTDGHVSHMLALAPDGTRVFTTNMQSGSVSAIDLARGETVDVVATGPKPEALCVTPDGGELWVGHNGNHTLVVLDARTLEKRAEVACGPLPIRIACTPDGQQILVTCALSGELAVIDRASRKELARIPLPRRATPAPNAPPGVDPLNPLPVGVLVEPSGRRAYVALSAADAVAVVDLETRAVLRTLPTGTTPDGMAWAVQRREPFTFLAAGRD